ncbi:Stress-induced-phosphoprotein 1 [Echinococcus granulosus]|nr:Stress-induced-phosphoprotein 1 [Echinococcus granulosus]
MMEKGEKTIKSHRVGNQNVRGSLVLKPSPARFSSVLSGDCTRVMPSATELKDRGNTFLQQGKYDNAIDCYTSAIELDPKNHVLYSNRSAAYAKVGQYEDALKDAEECVKLNASWAKGYSRKGAALEFLKRFDEAEKAYMKAAKLDPSNVSILESLTSVRARVALKDLKSRVQAHPTLKDLLNDSVYVRNLELLEKNPEMLGLLMKDPKIMKTITTLFHVDEPMETDPSDSPSPSPPPPQKDPEPKPQLNEEESSALKEKELGNAAYKSRNFPSAIEHYEKAFQLNPKDITFLTNKSAVYFEMGDFAECIKTCEKAVDLGRDLHADYKLIAKALSRIGHCYEKQEDWANAKKYYDKALSEFRAPDIIKKSQALDKKLKEMEKQAYIDPDLAEHEKQLGNTAFSNGDFPAAMKHYCEAIKRNPNDPKLYSNRAACYSKLMEFSCALKDCETCITLDPKFIKGYLRKAACLMAMKDVTQARSAYRKALELDPNCEEARSGLLRCMSAEPDEESARQRAANDPEIQAILSDPAMRLILNQMSEDPSALREHLQNPEIAEKLAKLVDAGIIALR